MPLKNKTFLSNICLYTFLILGGGCTDEAGMENIGNTDRRIPLTISATVSRYTAIDKKNTSVTRTPIENDYTTEFSDGDAIGIFALRNFETPNVATIDGVYNLKPGLYKSSGRNGQLGTCHR
ncbi:hypothetical protein NXW75_01785 [Bacteroides xylanisolvens]|nr:hypothetical protein [Bacteroides xylanisolvens]